MSSESPVSTKIDPTLLVALSLTSYLIVLIAYNFGSFFAELLGDEVNFTYESFIQWYKSAVILGMIIGVLGGYIAGLVQWGIPIENKSHRRILVWITATGHSVWFGLLYSLCIFFDHDPVYKPSWHPFIRAHHEIFGVLVVFSTGIIYYITQWILTKKYPNLAKWFLLNCFVLTIILTIVTKSTFIWSDPLLPVEKPLSSWEGFPIMPNAIVGGEHPYPGEPTYYLWIPKNYSFTVDASNKEIQSFYESELGSLGWSLSSIVPTEDGTILTFTNGSDKMDCFIGPLLLDGTMNVSLRLWGLHN